MYLLATTICNLIVNQCVKGSDIMNKRIINLVLIFIFLTYYALKISNIISIRFYNEIGTYIFDAIIFILLLIYALKCKNRKNKIIFFIICSISLSYLLFNLFLMITGGAEKVIQSYKIDNNNSLESIYYLDVKEINPPIEIRYKHIIVGSIYCEQTIYIINDDDIYSSKDDFITKYPLESVYNNIKNDISGICGRKLVQLDLDKKELFKDNNSIALEGRWTSTRDSLIRVIKEYKDGQPVYANNNIVEYWLDLKKDGKYALYFNDVADESRSNYNIEKNLIEKGKYNISSNNKIYFDSDNKNLPSNSASYIWICEVEGENLHNCTNYAYDFVKQANG